MQAGSRILSSTSPPSAPESTARVELPGAPAPGFTAETPTAQALSFVTERMHGDADWGRQAAAVSRPAAAFSRHFHSRLWSIDHATILLTWNILHLLTPFSQECPKRRFCQAPNVRGFMAGAIPWARRAFLDQLRSLQFTRPNHQSAGKRSGLPTGTGQTGQSARPQPALLLHSAFLFYGL